MFMGYNIYDADAIRQEKISYDGKIRGLSFLLESLPGTRER
jgi:hypothetical protein